MELRYFVEVEVIGDDDPAVQLGQLNQFQIHFPNLRKVVLDDADLEIGVLLNLLQNVETAAAAIAFQRIGRVRHLLKFAEDELRNHQNAIKEAGLDDVGNTAVNNDAGIEDFEHRLTTGFGAKKTSKGRQVEHFAFGPSDGQAAIGHDQESCDLKKGDAGGLVDEGSLDDYGD